MEQTEEEQRMSLDEWAFSRRTILAFFVGAIIFAWESKNTSFCPSASSKAKLHVVGTIWYGLAWILLGWLKFVSLPPQKLKESRLDQAGEFLIAVVMGIAFGWIVIPCFFPDEIKELSMALGEARGWATSGRSYSEPIAAYRLVPYGAASTFGVVFWGASLCARPRRSKIYEIYG